MMGNNHCRYLSQRGRHLKKRMLMVNVLSFILNFTAKSLFHIIRVDGVYNADVQKTVFCINV